MDRRTLIAGAVSLPLLPATGAAAQAANATDAAWAEYRAARAAFQEWQAAGRAFDATLPEHLHPRQRPDLADLDWNREAWEAARTEWAQERALYPANPYELTDQRLDAFIDRIDGAANAVLETPAATLTDLERKMILVRDADGSEELRELDRVLADVRRLAGRAVS